MPQFLHEFGGSGPVIHLAVANGFPPDSYRPLVEALTPNYRVVSLPPRALWPDNATIEKPPTWSTLADDLLAGLEEHNLHDVILVGHSFGALASMTVAVQAPERIAGLCLLDPTILPETLLQSIDQARQKGRYDQLPLVAGARRRRAMFTDDQAAFAHWRTKKLFQDWSDEALWAYTKSVLRPSGNDEALTLSWPPEWEAHYYETVDTQPWSTVSALAAVQLPLLVISGATTNVFTPESALRMKALLPRLAYHIVPDHGHLFPLAAPHQTALLVRDWLRHEGFSQLSPVD